VENIVGLKPTLGLFRKTESFQSLTSRTRLDDARSVTDVAILLGVLQSPFGEVLGHQLPSNYTQFLDPNALDGASDRTRCALFRLQLLRQRHSG